MGNAVGPLSKRERWGLAALCALLALFGGLTVFRSALLSQRTGDLSVFLRAAWAVRAGVDVYDVTERGRFHYCYPPLLAILLIPLADPPAGADRSGFIPYAASAGVCYALNLLALALGVHWLAGALEATSADAALREQPRFCRRWWALRVVPILVCFPAVGHTLMRGQINFLVLALLCGMAAPAPGS